MILSRRAEVVLALAAAGEAGISGETLAGQFGVSRMTVSNDVAALRELGYEIHAASRAGYRLLSAPDACIPEEVAPRLRDPLWVSCEGGPELASTNDEAKRLARAGAPEGTAVVAARQTGGRGRLGRVWESPAGGSYTSCILRPQFGPATTPQLSLTVAVGVARALEALGVHVGLKWPNDVVVDGRKLAGILLEIAAEAETVQWAVVGCGVNVERGAHERSVGVREFLPNVKIAGVAAAVLDGVAGAYRELLEEGFGGLRDEFETRATLTGNAVTVCNMAGEVVVDGVVKGVGAGGELLLQIAGGVIPVNSGEVTLSR